MFTFPFCYTPTEDIIFASKQIINKIDNSAELKAIFAEGKMLGVLQAKSADGAIVYLYAFSGLAGGKSRIEGFVDPVFDIADPDGHYRREEAAISSEPDPEIKKNKSRALQEWLFRQYIVFNARGEKKSILDIFADKGLVPPGGTGDCAGPKLLQYAYMHSLEPLAMGEFWYGASSHKEIRIEGDFYPSCTGKCGPLLEFMLQGLDVEPNPLLRKVNEPYSILYEDESIIVADKPSGLLSVPGKTGEESLLEILAHKLRMKLYPCHRLDMDTSGVMLFAKNQECYVCLSQQFEQRLTAKEYIARLCPPQIDRDSEGLATSGIFSGSKGQEASEFFPGSKGQEASGFFPGSERSGMAECGTISLPLICDWYDRPRQMVDFENGKEAVTDYRIIDRLPDGSIFVRLHPLTGRTHQLRVHCAHPDGLGRPIMGDRLYGGERSPAPGISARIGGCSPAPGISARIGDGSPAPGISARPLYLHAAKLSFLHPLTGAPVSFESPVPAYFEFTTDVASGCGDSEGQALPLRGSLPLVPRAASLPNPHTHSQKNNNK